MKATKLFAKVAIILCVILSFTACSTQKSIEAAFAKNGYTMQLLSPAHQKQLAPMLNYFPTLNLDAIGYLELDNSITFIYNADEATLQYYGDALIKSGFQYAGIGYVKGDYNTNMTYNVSGKVTTLYNQPLLIITYTRGNF